MHFCCVIFVGMTGLLLTNPIIYLGLLYYYVYELLHYVEEIAVPPVILAIAVIRFSFCYIYHNSLGIVTS